MYAINSDLQVRSISDNSEVLAGESAYAGPLIYDDAGNLALVWDAGTVRQKDSAELLLARKKQKKTAVNAKREVILAAGFWWPDQATGNLFDTDEVAALNVTGAVTNTLLGWLPAADFTWRTADNVDRLMTAADIKTLGSAMAAWRNAVYKHSWLLKSQIDAAADLAAVDAIDINSGWPAEAPP